MQKIFLICFLLISALAVKGQAVLYEEGRIYVKLNPLKIAGNDISQDNLSPGLKKLFQENGMVRFSPLTTKFPELAHVYSLSFSNTGNTEEFINNLRKLPEVNYAERIPVPTSSAFIPGDLNANIMWYFSRINMVDSWNFLNKGTKVQIAVVDNGVRLSHEDINDNLWTNPGEIPDNNIDDDNNGYIDDIHGYDVADDNGDPNVPLNRASNTFFTHGTHVAGLTSASTDNSLGTVAVGINTEIIAIKVVKDNAANDFEFYTAYEGVLYAIAAGAEVINLSWGSTAFSETQRSIINMAIDRGCIVIAAAGNDNSEQPRYPAAFEGVIAVGSTDNNDRKAPTSNFGEYVSLMAPGVNIYSTLAGGDDAYGYMTGTSQSAPIVAGFVGLILSQYPYLKDSILKTLQRGCDNIDLDNWEYTGLIGAGRINVDRTFAVIKDPRLNTSVALPLELHIYPNPSNGLLYFHGDITITQVEVYDLSGKLVYATQVNEQQANLASLDLQGLYLVKFHSEQGSSTSRVVFH